MYLFTILINLKFSHGISKLKQVNTVTLASPVESLVDVPPIVILHSNLYFKLNWRHVFRLLASMLISRDGIETNDVLVFLNI